jgi:hypothetical protein
VAMCVLDRSLPVVPIKVSVYMLCQFSSIPQVSVLDK